MSDFRNSSVCASNHREDNGELAVWARIAHEVEYMTRAVVCFALAGLVIYGVYVA